MAFVAEQAFRQHYRRVYHYLRRRGRTHGDAEDITQQVFLDAVRALDTFHGEDRKVLSWLYVVAERRLRDEIRRSRRRLTPAAEKAPAIVSTPASTYGSATARVLRTGIAQLPDGQQRVVVLKLLHGLSFDEIGRQLAVSEAACKMRFFRGLEGLRTFLEEEDYTPS
jgi:RNA polymerase sigma-70 factor (ECF subfamily)